MGSEQSRPAVNDAPTNSFAESPFHIIGNDVPDLTFYRPEFQSNVCSGMDIARQIAEVIVQLRSLSPQSNLLDLEHLAVDLSHYQCSNAKIIGVLGNSGEGKSTIINSLLNYPELACTGDSGIACTSLISEYRYKKPEHTAPIHIEVERLSEPEIHELVNELVWNYRKLYLPDVKDKTTKEYEELERESNLAWSTLNTAFGHKEEFNKKMIELDSQDGLKKVTSKLISWTMELEWPKGEGDDPKIWKATAQDAIECCKNTEIFMKDRFWPFTKIVRVYLDSPLLRAGIVLADMPGLQDTNLARVRMTQEYFIQCNTILVVAGIARAVTNQSLKSLLNTVLSRDIVDNLKSSSAHHSKQFVGPENRILPSDMDELDQSIVTATEADDFRTSNQLILRRKLKFIQCRNEVVEEGLHKAYSKKLQDSQLEIFCISNTLYEESVAKQDTGLVDASGIPALRRFCYGTTASAQLISTKNFLESQLGNLLCSVQIWLDKNQDKFLADIQKATFATTINESKQKGKILFLQFEDKLKSLVKIEIHNFGRHLNCGWTKAAQEEAEKHTLCNNSIYSAFCRRDGYYKAKDNAFKNWNQDIIRKMRMELESQWDEVFEEATKLFVNIQVETAKLFSDIIEAINREESTVPSSSTLVAATGHRERDLRCSLLNNMYAMTDELKLLQSKASNANANSYIFKVMQPYYRSAAQESGLGKTARQMCIIRHPLNEKLFTSMLNSLVRDMKKVFAKHSKQMNQALMRVWAAIRKDIGSDGDVTYHGIDLSADVNVFLGCLNKLKDRHEQIVKNISELE